MVDTQRWSAKDAAAVLRELADALEKGTISWWDMRVEALLADVSTVGSPHFVETGKRDVEFRATVHR